MDYATQTNLCGDTFILYREEYKVLSVLNSEQLHGYANCENVM